MTNIKPDNGMDPAVEELEVVGEVRAKSDAYGGGTFVLWKQLPVAGMKLVDLASAQAAVAALEETVRQLNHALRDATEAPTFMGEPTTNELVTPLVRSQYQHKRAQERITQLEAENRDLRSDEALNDAEARIKKLEAVVAQARKTLLEQPVMRRSTGTLKPETEARNKTIAAIDSLHSPKP